MHLNRTDVISALMEVVTFVLVWIDFAAIRKDKQLKGSRVYPKLYWLGYSVWGTYLFFLYGLTLSCIVAGIAASLYAGYVATCFYYHYNPRDQEEDMSH